jgi:hypothetical protein
MAIDEKTIQLELTGSETLVEIKEYPSIKALFLKMFFLSMVRRPPLPMILFFQKPGLF